MAVIGRPMVPPARRAARHRPAITPSRRAPDSGAAQSPVTAPPCTRRRHSASHAEVGHRFHLVEAVATPASHPMAVRQAWSRTGRCSAAARQTPAAPSGHHGHLPRQPALAPGSGRGRDSRQQPFGRADADERHRPRALRAAGASKQSKGSAGWRARAILVVNPVHQRLQPLVQPSNVHSRRQVEKGSGSGNSLGSGDRSAHLVHPEFAGHVRPDL